ncbi:hypothetical protein AQI95_32420 [Streptomyces yokosukanensis]|uniref:Uncharacterized protein n=1 Tax=Streptomyces yokosukanensis TaxID=67386 RepID=A0A117PZV9_9ACTN|nr:hypothetical protein [Streptomyces yokosukanensis]KUN01179.1 hypothetical protein AQI95_32420 [Streptomyces yokosukanensis]
MGWGTRRADADEESLDRAERAAVARGLGQRSHAQWMGSRLTGLGCVSLMPALFCGIVGAGLLGGSYGVGVKGFAVCLLVLVVALPVAGFRIESRLTHRDRRLYVYERGIVVTEGPARTHVLTWPEVRLTEKTESTTHGQHSHGSTVHWLYLKRPDGTPLTRISTSNPAGLAVARAVAEARGGT